MPKWFARRMLPAVALAAVSAVAFAQSPPVPRPVAPMPTPSAGERQVRVECVLLAMPPAAWAKHAAALSMEGPAGAVAIDEPKAMAFVQMVKEKGGAEVLTRPQMLLLDRQTGFFHVGQACQEPSESCGLTLRLTPKVAADGSKVVLTADCQHKAECPAFGGKLADGRFVPGYTMQTIQISALLADGGVAIAPITQTDAAQHVLVLKASVSPAGPRTMAIPVAELLAPWLASPGKPWAIGEFLPVDAPRMMPPVYPAVSPAGFAIPAPKPIAAPPAVDPWAANAEALSKLVANTVRPHSWACNGGTGTLAFDARSGSMIVSGQPADVQAEVAQFVEALRSLKGKFHGPQVMIETRVVEVADTFFERLGVEFQSVREGEKTVAFLSDEQLAAVISAVEAQREANVLAAPMMVVSEGQRGDFQVGQREVFQTGLELTATPGGVIRKPKMEAVELGMHLAVTPIVSADRRFIRLDLRYKTASLAGVGPAVPVVAGFGNPADALCRPSVQTGEAAVKIAVPDGRTAVVVGPAVGRNEVVKYRPPYFSFDFPTGLEPAVASTRPVMKRQLLLVTPRIVLADATKAVAQACCSEPCGECRANPAVADLVAAYRKACAEGRTDAAAALAVKALALDPMCFAASNGSK